MEKKSYTVVWLEYYCYPFFWPAVEPVRRSPCRKEQMLRNGQGKTSAVRYVVEEQTIPDAENGMVLPDGSKYVQSKVQLYPHSIVENGIEYDNDGRYVGSYTQVWNDDTEQWKHVENDNTGFDIDDVALSLIHI